MADTTVPPVSLDSTDPQAVPVMTAGPWELSDVREFGARKVIAWTIKPNGHRWRKTICELRDGNMDEDESEANARGIAALPDLVALTERIADHFADTDAPIGIEARRILDRVKGGAR